LRITKAESQRELAQLLAAIAAEIVAVFATGGVLRITTVHANRRIYFLSAICAKSNGYVHTTVIHVHTAFFGSHFLLLS